MSKIQVALAMSLGMAALSVSGEASAAGCLKGAAGGAVAGHFVGKGHAVAGAAGGCAIGHHVASKKAKKDAAAASESEARPAQQGS